MQKSGGVSAAWMRIGVGIVALTLMAVWPGGATAQTQEARVTRLDAELANACVESGKGKRSCVCEVRLLRLSVDPHDYAASALLQTAAYRGSLPTARVVLGRQGMDASELKALDIQRRRIVRERLQPACAHSETRDDTS